MVMFTSSHYDANSTNFFDVEKEFFVIDSDNLDKVATKFYGFSVQETGIFEEANMTKEALANLDGCGCYISITREEQSDGAAGGGIRIQQDFNGCYGLYLFKSADYFALSNSFLRLVDYIKYRFPLTLNRDYANYFLLTGLCSESYSETIINEIKVIDKDAVVTIDTNTANIKFDLVDYGEGTIQLNSPEGIRTLDRWYEKWTSVFRHIKRKTDQIVIDLSGGIDSRLTFLLMLKSGVDINTIKVNSAKDELHTHKEDFEIASEIADYYGFKLNRPEPSSPILNYSLSDILSLSAYTKLSFHKQMYYKYGKSVAKRICIRGAGGECLRGYWNMSIQDFLMRNANRSNRYPFAIAKEMYESAKKTLVTALQEVIKKHNPLNDELVTLSCLYREGRSRSHFGKWAVESCLAGIYTLTPLIDPVLRRLKLNDVNCLDNDLLISLIFIRYCPELLNFRFQGNKFIKDTTIQYAKEINEQCSFALREPSPYANKAFSLITTDADTQSLISRGINNKQVISDIPDQYLKSVFNSVSFRKLFATYFDEEIYVYASNHSNIAKYFPLSECYAVLGVTKAIEDVETSFHGSRLSLIQSLNRFVSNNSYEPSSFEDLPDTTKDYLTARIDIKISGDQSDFELIRISDARAKVTTPVWFNKNGKGYVVESYQGNLELGFKIAKAGQLRISLRGKNIHGEDGKRQEYWIKYKKMIIDGRPILKKEISAWHDKPAVFTYHAEETSVLMLYVAWVPRRFEEPLITEEYEGIKSTDLEKIKKYDSLRCQFLKIFPKGSIRYKFAQKFMKRALH